MNDIDWQQVDKETVNILQINLEAAYKQIRDLADVINSQNDYIANLKQRFRDHGIDILEKSITELTREELIRLNKSIPAIRTRKASNPDKIKMPTTYDMESMKKDAQNHYEGVLLGLINLVTVGVDLEKYGIDPTTLNFKPGYGPNGKIENPKIEEPKITFWHKIKKLFM
jgi:hypothetical protein